MGLSAVLGALFGAALLLCAAGAGPGQREFDFFVFVRQWPGTVCSDHAARKCARPPTMNIFTLHGLWPQYTKGGWPEECRDDDFDPSEVSDDVLSRMQWEWPSYYGPDEGFWNHEWTKHGTCASSVLPDEEAYFGAVLDLNERYNLTAALDNADIPPGTDQAYATASIANAIKTTFGAGAFIHCKKGEVYEVWMCINKDLEAFDCPGPLAERAQSENAAGCSRSASMPPIPDFNRKAAAWNRKNLIS